MTAPELRTLLVKLLADAEAACSIAKTAEDGRQSLDGGGRYAKRFHDAVVSITAAENKVRPHLAGLELPAADLETFYRSLAILKDSTPKAKNRWRKD
jgi:hypothetical protein